MKKEEAKDWLHRFIDTYLIVGYAPDGIRGIPATYKQVIATCWPTDVIKKIEGLTDFKVFKIGPSQMTTQQWIEFKNNSNDAETREREIELLNQLKAKYEK